MEFEAEEPSHGAFATLGYAFEHPGVMNPFVVADLQRGALQKGETYRLYINSEEILFFNLRG